MAHESRAGETDSLGGGAAAFREGVRAAAADSAAVGDSSPAAGGSFATSLASPSSSQAGATWGGPFTVRRVTNPRYRPPGTGAPLIGPGARSRLRALDHVRAQLFHQGSRGPQGITQWEIEAGEQYRSNDALEVAAAGGHRLGRPVLDGLRVSGRHGRLEGSVMDAEPMAVGRLAFLHRLRGAVMRYTDPRSIRWLALGGVPTPASGLPTPRIALGGGAVENLRFDAAELSAVAFGFHRGAPPVTQLASLGADTLAGRGAAGVLGWRVPVAGGRLAARLGAQLHSLDGRRSLAVQHALEWSYQSPALVATLSDERGTRRARVIGTDRLAPAPRREQRWNLQRRFARGRAETHLTGVLRDGGDPALAARTVQAGASGNLGRSPWYGGLDAVWDRRALTGSDARVSLYGGGLMARGHALLARIEHAARGSGEDAVAAQGEVSLALERGARLALEPRFAWSAGYLEQGNFTVRFSWPLAWLSTRITSSLAAGALRDDDFRPSIREAALAVSFAPRLRDRGDLEVRRLDQGGRPVMEYGLSYDALVERYETPGQGWFAGRDTGRVTVRVVRSGNGTGVSDILVSLDGRELRFTDADGMVRFDRVPPGIHVVAVEERSLPPNHEVVYASRIFVTVEPGRAPEPVLFAVARSERRTKF